MLMEGQDIIVRCRIWSGNAWSAALWLGLEMQMILGRHEPTYKPAKVSWMALMHASCLWKQLNYWH
jgi:hypothetical protein